MEHKLQITSDKIQKALDFAINAHEGDHRVSIDGEIPYVTHPIEVATVIQEHHPENENAIIGALLHDTVEDTNVTIEDIKNNFGPKIAKIVSEVTDDESNIKHLPREELKKARRQLQVDNLKNISFEAQLIRLGDKISNVSNLNSVDKSIEWQNNYVKFVKEVHNELKDLNTPLVDCLDYYLGFFIEDFGLCDGFIIQDEDDNEIHPYKEYLNQKKENEKSSTLTEEEIRILLKMPNDKPEDPNP